MPRQTLPPPGGRNLPQHTNPQGFHLFGLVNRVVQVVPQRIPDTYVQSTVTARVEVKEKVTEKNRVKLRTTCVNQDGTLLVDGEATIMAPKAPKK